MAPEVFAALPDSGAVAEISKEPNGFEPELAASMLAVLWQTSMGAFAEDFLQLTAAQANALRTFALGSVRASGPIPALRVGRQPYGVLPVTSLSDFVAAPSEGIDRKLLRLLGAVRTWYAMRRQPPVFPAEDTDDALRQLGRSIRLLAETTPQVGQQPGPNRSEKLAWDAPNPHAAADRGLAHRPDHGRGRPRATAGRRCPSWTRRPGTN